MVARAPPNTCGSLMRWCSCRGRTKPGTECWNSCEKTAVENIRPKPPKLAHGICSPEPSKRSRCPKLSSSSIVGSTAMATSMPSSSTARDTKRRMDMATCDHTCSSRFRHERGTTQQAKRTVGTQSGAWAEIWPRKLCTKTCVYATKPVYVRSDSANWYTSLADGPSNSSTSCIFLPFVL